METRDFLPGEPVVGDIVVCIDGSWPAIMRVQPREVPQSGKLYRVRRTQDCLDADWGEHEIIRLVPYPTIGAFHLPVKGGWSSFRFKATHDPQREWPKGAGTNILKADAASLDPMIDEPLRRLWIARQCGVWRQLCQSNFGLGLALAVLHPSPCDDPTGWQDGLADAASMRRLEICRQLGFPASASTLRIFSRLHQSWGQAFRTMLAKGMLLVLRQLLNHDLVAPGLLERHRLISRAHVAQLAFGTNELGLPSQFTDEPEILRATWFFRLPAAQRHWLAAEFQTIGNREADTAGVALLPEARRLGTFQREKDAVAYLRDRRRMLDLLDSWGRRVGDARNPQQWPEPPLPGSDIIQPITSIAQLIEEGADFKHCIANYADHIALGVYFAYRMTDPTRCTVGLRWSGKRWVVDQIRGRGNSRIEEKQTKMVLEWIESHVALAGSLQSDVAEEVCRGIGFPKRPHPRGRMPNPLQPRTP